jgi:hypothetical protein
MAIIRKKVNTPSGLQHIVLINSTSSINGYTGNIEEINVPKQGEPVDAEKVLKLIQDLVYNDTNVEAQMSTFFPLISEGVLPARGLDNFKLITNDIVTSQLREVTLTNPTTSIKIKAADCRIKVEENIVVTSGDQDFVTVTPGVGQVQINPVVLANGHRTVLLQMKTTGLYDLKYLGSETLLKPDHASRLDEDSDGYALYSFILKRIGADTKIISIKRIFDYSGFNNFFLRDYVAWHRSKEYDNVFRLFLEDSRHLRKENFDLLDQTYATATDNSLAEVELSDAVFYNNDASAAQAKFKFDSLIFPEVLPEPDHNIYSYPGDTTTGSGIYHYIVPGDQNSAAIPFPEYPSPASGLRSIGHLYFNKVANAGAFQNTAKLKSLTLALYKSPLAAFDDNIKVAIVNFPRFKQNTVNLEEFNCSSVTTPIVGITEIVCNTPGVLFNNLSAWSTDYPSFQNGQLNEGDIVFFTSGACAGYSSKITQIIDATTIRIESLSNPVSANDDFIIFKNVPITPQYIAGEVEYDETYLNAQRTIALGPATNLVSSSAGTDDYFKITKDNLAINIYKEKFYFIIPKVAVATDDVVSNVPMLLVNNNLTNVGNGDFRNIYFYATYFPSVGAYPDNSFTLYDLYGDISSSSASRQEAWSGILDRWDILPKDLNDTEIDELYDGSWVGIAQNQCFVDVTRGIALFHPDYAPMSLYGKYRIESFVGAETNTSEIRRQGTLTSIEDWMKDKFPDGVDSGLAYVKKIIKSRDNRPITIPAGYTAFMAEDAILFGNLNIEENAELVVLNKRQLSFLLGITQGLTPGWNEQIIEGVGTLQYPEFRTYTLNSEVVRVTYTYNVDNNPLTKTYEYSKNNGVTWSLIGIKNFVYSGLYLTNTYWT